MVNLKDLELLKEMMSCMGNAEMERGFEIGCKVVEEQVACYLEELSGNIVWAEAIDAIRTGKYLEIASDKPVVIKRENIC